MAGVQRSKGLSKSCILLIVIAGMERFAFKGVASNLVTYLTDVVKMSNSAAAKTVNNWCGLTSIMPLLVAPLAESLWDRFFTILASSFIYILGLIAVTYTAFDHSKETDSYSFLFLSLSVISLGQGGFNPSLQAFAADQLGDEDELPCSNTAGSVDSNERRSRFFTMWYFGICAGSLMGVSLMAYIQDTLGWGIGFAIPSMAMVLSVLFFTCGTRLYSVNQDHEDGKENPVKKLVRLVRAALRRVTKGRDVAALQTKSLRGLDTKEFHDEKQESSLVRHAKVVLNLLPIWTMLLIFAVIFQQPATFFTKQGMTMKRSFGCKLKIPPATLQSAITVSIIALMPLYDKFLIPFMKRITRSEKGINVMQRMGVGMILSTLAMVIAALVEEKRLKTSMEMTKSDEYVAMSIFWLLPQYILLGVADIFTVVGMQEFFYGEVPIKMRTMGIALYTSVFGVGSFMSSVLISLVEVFSGGSGGGGGGWFADDMREARIDKYYWLLAVLSSVSFVVYIILCKCYRSMKSDGV
ncbi:hypothetical protein V2J09_023003 [Rumex salicifolius]